MESFEIKQIPIPASNNYEDTLRRIGELIQENGVKLQMENCYDTNTNTFIGMKYKFNESNYDEGSFFIIYPNNAYFLNQIHLNKYPRSDVSYGLTEEVYLTQAAPMPNSSNYIRTKINYSGIVYFNYIKGDNDSFFFGLSNSKDPVIDFFINVPMKEEKTKTIVQTFGMITTEHCRNQDTTLLHKNVSLYIVPIKNREELIGHKRAYCFDKSNYCIFKTFVTKIFYPERSGYNFLSSDEEVFFRNQYDDDLFGIGLVEFNKKIYLRVKSFYFCLQT